MNKPQTDWTRFGWPENAETLLVAKFGEASDEEISLTPAMRKILNACDIAKRLLAQGENLSDCRR